MIDAREAADVPCVTVMGPAWVERMADEYGVPDWQRRYLHSVLRDQARSRR